MMTKNNNRRRIEISIETHEIKTIRIRGGGTAFCGHCKVETSVFSSEQIAALLKISISEVCHDIETGKFHLTESDGAGLICGDSLRR